MIDLERISVRLAEGKVDFVIAGGMAALILGGSLMTRDVNVVCSLDAENLLRLFDTLKELNPVHRMTPQRIPFTREHVEKGGLKNLYLSTDLGQLDCLGDIKGIGGYDECLARSEDVQLSGGTIKVLSLDAMIDAKRAMGRPRDLHTVLELEAIRDSLRKTTD
jgi:hypothetical protein